MKKVILVGLNEVNFDFIQRYAQKGHLPYLSLLIKRHGVVRTESEAEYKNIEPWIQWASIQTGLSYNEHGIFRLGDIVGTKHKQIWETTEAMTGDAVVAVCPMNARNEVRHPESIFIPDPWTDTPATGPWMLCRLSRAVSKFVNNNAGGKLHVSDYVSLAGGLLAYARAANFSRYIHMVLTARSASWRKALLLDMFLGDLLCKFVARRNPAFASVFLNAAAYVQHHYMLSSPLVEGSNPEWYVTKGYDPLLEAYQAYDRIVQDIATQNVDSRLLIATGLHQNPNKRPIYYWRPTDHHSLMSTLGVNCKRILPRMSRDFLLEFDNSTQTNAAANRLDEITVNGKDRLFHTDVRDCTLFVEVIYGSDFDPNDELHDAGNVVVLPRAKREFSFVAIKNGVHDQEGYLIDTGKTAAKDTVIPVQEIFREIIASYA